MCSCNFLIESVFKSRCITFYTSQVFINYYRTNRFRDNIQIVNTLRIFYVSLRSHPINVICFSSHRQYLEAPILIKIKGPLDVTYNFPKTNTIFWCNGVNYIVRSYWKLIFFALNYSKLNEVNIYLAVVIT